MSERNMGMFTGGATGGYQALRKKNNANPNFVIRET